MVRSLAATTFTGEGERSLLDECVRGDVDAWRALHAQYAPLAALFLRRLGVSDADLEDATQEVFLQLFRYLSRFRREAELSTWLYRLCISQAGRVRRRVRLGKLLSGALGVRSAEAFVSTPGLPEEIARRRIEAALAVLSPAERSVFVLYEMQGVSGKDIAAIVDCPEATVWRRLHYARERFRAALAASGVG
ncbi:MAG TPA: RNA polymerase sigma factor [Polyangiaceae bacterium]|nr:RNA polymerase sigma factor [Polyangiaceae bacterium]